MKPPSIDHDMARARTSRRLALFSVAVAVLVAVGWQSSPASGADDRIPAMYLPLIDHHTGDGATTTATAEATASPTATATPSATATSTPQTIDVNGAVYVRPKHHVLKASSPLAYVVVLDTSGSMNLNFNGEAKDGAATLQCGPSNDPARQAKYQQDFARCQQIDAMWLPKSERRIYVVKAALMNFIDQISSNDSMQIVASSSERVGTTTTGWEIGTPAGKQGLKDAVLNAGLTNNDPYQTSGGTTSASGLNQARQLLSSLPAQAPNGQPYIPRVIFLTDGVANHFLNAAGNPAGFGWYNDARDNPACQNRWDLSVAAECQVGTTNTTPSILRPINAMVNEADEIKQINGGNLQLYVIAIADFNTLGLPNVASQPSFPYYAEARTPDTVNLILDAILDGAATSTCVPSGGTSWLSDIDGAHTVSDPAERALFNLPADTSIYGYAYLYNTNGQSLQAVPVRKDAQTGKLSYTFSQVAAGTYS
jgi:hypothetical protein